MKQLGTRSETGDPLAGGATDGNRPSGNEELLAFVADTFGYRIPDVDCCPEHQAPARAFCDAYFGRDAVAIWKASRGFGGKSTLLALLALTEAVTLGADVTVLGGSGQQSERVLETLAQIWRDRSGIQYLFASGPGVRRTTLTFGNTITALPASQTAVRGPHPQRLRIDEADEMSLPLLEAAQGQPMDRSDVQAQTVISSTHQYPDGTMTTLLQRAASQGWPLYTWCWQETLEPHGWLRQAQVDRKRGEISGQMWSIEFDLQEPTAQGRAIDPDAVEWTFDASLGNSNAAALEHGWEAASGEPGEQPRPGRYAHGADWAQAAVLLKKSLAHCGELWVVGAHACKADLGLRHLAPPSGSPCLSTSANPTVPGWLSCAKAGPR